MRRFSASNVPGWANFDSATVTLSGIPGDGDVGIYDNIVISTSDGEFTASLAAFSVEVVAYASGSITLTWDPPTENTDGSYLENLAGYVIYYGTQAQDLCNTIALSNPGLTSYVVDNLALGTWYFSITALNSVDQESALSNVASVLLD